VQNKHRTQAALIVAKTKTGAPVWEAKWWDGAHQVKRRVGPAFLVAREWDPDYPHAGHGEKWRRSWIEPLTRAGHPKNAPKGDERLTLKEARERAAEIVAAYYERQAEHEADAERLRLVTTVGPKTLNDVGTAWLAYSERVRGMRKSTADDHRITLRKLSRHKPFAGAVETITAKSFEAYREGLLSAGTSPRTCNKERQLMSSVLGWGAASDDFPQLVENVMTKVEKIAEPRPGRVDFYEPEEVEHIARILRHGEHRRQAKVATGPRAKGRQTVERELSNAERAARDREDAQDAVLVIVLAFCGLRLGEALALRWRDVNFTSGKVEVWRSYSGGVEGPTKSGHERTVSMIPQVARALAQLSQRPLFAGRDDLVFVGTTGSYLDPSAFRRRYKRACKLAGLRPLRVHDLRHGFLSIAARVFMPHEVQRLAGHADPRTTARYMHAKAQPHEADRLAAAFTSPQSDDLPIIPTVDDATR